MFHLDLARSAMNLVYFCTVAVYFASFQCAEGVDVNFVKIETCTTSNKTMAEVEKCEIHADGSFDVMLNVKQPMNNLKVSTRLSSCDSSTLECLQFYVSLFIKRGSKFIKIFKVPTLDWCALVDDGKNANPFVRRTMQLLKQDVPQLIHSCPLKGRYDFDNVRPNKSFGTMFPVGFYRFTIKSLDENENEISFAFLLEISEWF